VLQRLSEDKLEVNEESGEVTISEPKKVRGLGFVDFPARAVISAIQAGVPVVSVQIPFSIADRSYAATLAVCREYKLKVLARDGLLGGIISERFLDAPEPESTRPDADLDDVAHSLDLVNNYGGWDKVQALLKVVKRIADKHGGWRDTMQT
jgi:aryl-alcohol dehydrogenase-like predicted oxidoreductase